MQEKRYSKRLIITLFFTALVFTGLVYHVAASKDSSSSGGEQSTEVKETATEIIVSTPSSTPTNTPSDNVSDSNEVSPALLKDAEFYASVWGITVEEAIEAITNPLTEEEAITRDATFYAEDMGITIDEAIERLELQDDAGRLDARLTENESDTFAGLWIQHEPEYRIVVAFTKDGEKSILPYIENLPLAEYVEVRQAGIPLSKLRDQQIELTKAMIEEGLEVASGINVFDNKVELYVTDKTRLDAVLQQSKIELPMNVETFNVSGLAVPLYNIYGGHTLDCIPGTGLDCPGTSGFGVSSDYGGEGITTAGHISNELRCWEDDNPWSDCEDNDLLFQFEELGGSYDIQWNTAPGYHITNQFYAGIGGVRPVNEIIPWEDQAIGAQVAKYGKTTGYTWGYIIDKNYYYQGAYTWIRVHRDGSGPLGLGGDSGGPCFWGMSAYGSSTFIVDDDLFYMPVDYIEDIGITIMTSTTPDTDVTIEVSLQGANRPIPEGYEVPLTVGFWSSNSTWGPGELPNPDDPADYLLYEFTGTATYNAGKAELLCEAIPPGTYDITVDSTTTLMNIKDNVVIPAP